MEEIHLSSRASSKQFITSNKSKDVEQQLKEELVPRITSYGSVAFDEEPDEIRHANWVRNTHGFFPPGTSSSLTRSLSFLQLLCSLGYLFWPHYNCSNRIWCSSSTSIHCMDRLDRWHVHLSSHGGHHLVHISSAVQPHCHR